MSPILGAPAVGLERVVKEISRNREKTGEWNWGRTNKIPLKGNCKIASPLAQIESICDYILPCRRCRGSAGRGKIPQVNTEIGKMVDIAKINAEKSFFSHLQGGYGKQTTIEVWENKVVSRICGLSDHAPRKMAERTKMLS